MRWFKRNNTTVAVDPVAESDFLTRPDWREVPAPPAARMHQYSAYGDWSEQRPEHDTYGRWDSAMTQTFRHPILGLTHRLTVRYDRAEYDMLKRLGVPENPTDQSRSARDCAWRIGSWSMDEGMHIPAIGLFEVDMKLPAAVGVGFALMLWSDANAEWPKGGYKTGKIEWPDGEINIAEHTSTPGHILTNMHWGERGTNEQHAPQEIAVDVSRWHRYSIDVQPGRLEWFIDGKSVRVLERPEVPYGAPMHIALQLGAHRGQIGTDRGLKVAADGTVTWPDDFQYEEHAYIRPVTIPKV